MRATESDPPPAEKGTTNVIGLTGYWASVGAALSRDMQKAATICGEWRITAYLLARGEVHLDSLSWNTEL